MMRSRISIVLLIVGDSLLVFLSLSLAHVVRASIGQSPDDSLFAFAARHPLLLSAVMVIYLFSFFVFDLYNINNSSFQAQFKYAYAGAILLSTFLIILQFWFLPFRLGRGVLFFNLIILTTVFLPWRIFIFRWVLGGISPQNVLVIGTAEEDMGLYSFLDKFRGYRVCGHIPTNPNDRSGEPNLLKRKIEKIQAGRAPDIIVIGLDSVPRSGLSDTLLWARARDIPVVDFPTFYERLTNKIPISHINGDWLLLGAKFCEPRHMRHKKVKRCLDIIVASIFLILSLPLSLIIAALVKSTSKGPVFFIQERLGKDKKFFSIWKFRTMVVKAEKGAPRWASPNDARMTTVGRFLRKARLDEIPQLINILRGDMSFVGPRPERDYFVRRLAEEVPYYSFRFFVKPGITGWAQINYHYGASVEDAREKLMYDLYYIKNQSLLLDLKIMAKTLKVIMLGAGR